jgi:hypothetical protein
MTFGSRYQAYGGEEHERPVRCVDRHRCKQNKRYASGKSARTQDPMRSHTIGNETNDDVACDAAKATRA